MSLPLWYSRASDTFALRPGRLAWCLFLHDAPYKLIASRGEVDSFVTLAAANVLPCFWRGVQRAGTETKNQLRQPRRRWVKLERDPAFIAASGERYAKRARKARARQKQRRRRNVS